MLEVGLRVVRGRDWKWNEQDGGEGHAGTVVEIGKPQSTSSGGTTPNHADKTPDKTVIVQWDHGSRSNYRIGYQNAYDLLVFDNAAAGVKHKNIICDGCRRHGIIGIRWKCAECRDFDLCTQCYMSDVHYVGHTFQRFQTVNSIGVQLGKREGCTKIPLTGIFIGAKVIRGPDWEWGNQDGGRGKSGNVIDIRGWDNESSRSVATVTWSTGSTNVYRLGYKGCVDLCYVEEAACGTYYKEHLPSLGEPTLVDLNYENALGVPGASFSCSAPDPSHLSFSVGDRVKVLMDIDTLKKMQAGHGGWNPRMAEYIGKVGVVHRVTDKGDIRVQYEGCNNRWTFHPGALMKITSEKDSFALGDLVRIKNDMAAVKHFQTGHGEWIDVMKTALGKTGKVIKIYSDGDMRVALDGQTWTFNPLSVTLVPPDADSALAQPETNRGSNDLGDTVVVEKLLRDTARGESGIPAVKEFLRKYPGRVDARAGGKTCLQVAAHQGGRELCTLLIDAGASLFAFDEDGDTPLHYAAFGNQPEIMELLLARGAKIDAVNHGICSALHVAVNKQHTQCVKTLLRHGCNVNLLDFYGDTALHDAIGKDAPEIIDLLCACDRTDYNLRNKRGFNVIHHAALKGNAYAMEKLVQRARQLVDVKKEDGFAALHLAALNGHRCVAAALLSPTGGRAKVDIRNNRRQTPLHLATSQGHWPVVELLVSHNADISSTDEDGDTALHIAITKSRHLSIPAVIAGNAQENGRDCPQIYAILQDLQQKGGQTELALACYLISVDTSGMVLEHVKNAMDKTPLDLLIPELNTPQSISRVWAYIYERRNRSTNNPSVESAEARLNQNNEESRTNQGSGSGETSESGKSQSIRDARKEEKCPEEPENDVKKMEEDLERLRYLETRIADLEEANLCSICMERRRNIAFLCGHGACEICAAPLKTCHMCRQMITKKINLY